MRKYDSPPRTIQALRKRCQNLAQGVQLENYLNRLAALVVSQMLPEGAVKGGTAMAFRYGADVRFTADLDVSYRRELADFVASFEQRLAEGWNGFTGVLIAQEAPRPEGIPAPYVMQPFRVKLNYLGRDWRSVHFELGCDELGATEGREEKLDDALAAQLSDLGFPRPSPVPVLPLPFQIAQKLHALTAENSLRSHDLVDLQIMLQAEELNLVEVKRQCVRTFRYRRAQSWPPSITPSEGWEERYVAATDELGLTLSVLPFEEALEWARKIIRRIDEASVKAETDEA